MSSNNRTPNTRMPNNSKMSMMDTWDSLCTPAKLYGGVSIISIFFMLIEGQFLGSILQGLFAIIWTLFLGWICEKGLSGLSWFLVLLPIITAVLILILITSGAVRIEEFIKIYSKQA